MSAYRIGEYCGTHKLTANALLKLCRHVHRQGGSNISAYLKNSEKTNCQQTFSVGFGAGLFL